MFPNNLKIALFFQKCHQLWTASSEGDLILLKAKQDVVLAGMKERHELEIKYSQERQEVLLQFLELSLSKQIGKEINKQECPSKRFEESTDAVSMESLSVVSIPKLFKDENEINSFCDDIYESQLKEFTPKIANKIVHVLNHVTSDTVSRCRVLSGVYSNYSEQNGKNLSDAGFGKAISALLCVHSNKLDIVKCINSFLWQDSILDVKFSQDLYDAIDSPDGFDGAIFDTLLKIMQRQNDRETIESGLSIAFYIIENTQFAKSIMIKKGFLDMLENFDNYKNRDILRSALIKE